MIRRALLGALVVAVIAGLVALGVWQLQRRVWKLDLIDRVETRLAAEPTDAPGPDAWPNLSLANDEYARVRATGTFLHDREVTVLAVTARGSGYWVVTPLATPGFTILVNRGFVPQDRRDPATRLQGQVQGPVAIEGLLRLTEPGGGFLRENDAGSGRWYSRDVAAIAEAQGLATVAPYFIDADAAPNPGGLPIGGLTVVRFRNPHLSYALTWFAMAGGLTAAVVMLARRA